MKSVIFFFGRIISYIIPHKLSYQWEAVKFTFFAGYKSRYFQSLGANSALGMHTTYIGEQNISIGQDTIIGDYGILAAYHYYPTTHQNFHPQILIGNNCNIGPQSHITAINKVILGNSVRTGPRVLITDNAHGESKKEVLNIPPNQRLLYSKGPVIIEDNVWVGEGSMIMPNVHIGEGAIIACNSVVTTNIPAYSLVAGSPAKIIKVFK